MMTEAPAPIPLRLLHRYAAGVSHVFDLAASGRAKCRGCGRPIQRGELRFGERLPNPFAEGEMTQWFHPACAAYKRPEPFLQALAETPEPVPDRERLERAARGILAHRRLPRIDGAEQAPSGQAKCRHCRQPIARGRWRIRLVFYEEGRFNPGGFVHLDCRQAYFETGDVLDQLLHFSADLSDAEREELRRACEGSSRG
jgi:poly(ADP-ribose) polymerase-like protein